MSQYNIVSSDAIQLDEFRISKIYKTTNGTTKGTVTHKKKPVLISTPTMVLGADVIKTGGHYLVDLAFNLKNKKNVELLSTIRGLDAATVSNIYTNGELWYPEQSDEPSLCQIEKDYVPTIKSSLIKNDQLSLKLKMPVDAVEFYDQNNVSVPYQLLKAGYSVTALLQLSEVFMEGQHIWLDWKMPQLKAIIPDAVLKGCHLVDVVDTDEDEDEDAIEEDPTFY